MSKRARITFSVQVDCIGSESLSNKEQFGAFGVVDGTWTNFLSCAILALNIAPYAKYSSLEG